MSLPSCPVLQARDSWCLHRAPLLGGFKVDGLILWNDNISMQSGIALCSNTSLGHREEICIKLRGVTGRIWRTQTATPVPVLYLKNVEALAPHGDWSPSAGFRAPVSALYCFGLSYSAHLFPEAEEHLCKAEPVPQVRRSDSRLYIFYTFQDHFLPGY